MASTTFTGPLVIFGSSGASNVPDYNPQQATSALSGGVGLLDPRAPFTYQTGQSENSPVYSFLMSGQIVLIDQVPSPAAAANIAAAQAPTAGTPLALVSVTGSGVTAGVMPTNRGTGQTVASAVAIDGVTGSIAQGAIGTYQLWDPRTTLARNVRITSAGNDSAASFLVSGLDVYGYPMSELITGANAGVASGRKAFKYIVSVMPTGTLSGSNVSVGTGDVIGLPVLGASWPYLTINYNGTVVTTSTGFTTADATSPATSATGDVRGTYALQSPSDGAKRLWISILIAPQNISSVTGLFGLAQA